MMKRFLDEFGTQSIFSVLLHVVNHGHHSEHRIRIDHHLRMRT